MSSKKCLQCGLVNFEATAECKRCQAPLRAEPPAAIKARASSGTARKVLGVVAGAVILAVVALFVWAFSVTQGVNYTEAKASGEHKFSSKAEQIEWSVNSVSEEECVRNTEKINGPFHEATAEERALGSLCYLKWVKAHQPAVWENSLSELRRQPAN